MRSSPTFISPSTAHPSIHPSAKEQEQEQEQSGKNSRIPTYNTISPHHTPTIAIHTNMDDQSNGIALADRAHEQRTPSKSGRAFGTRLSDDNSIASSSAIPTKLDIGPSEYAIRFPPGQSLWLLEFKPVTQISIGCGVAKILPEFYDKLNSNVVGYFPEPNRNVKEEAAASSDYSQTSPLTIKVNDLVVSINGTYVLTRKYDVIMEMLQHHERFLNVDRIIVFHSIKKLWHSRSSTSSYSNHLTRREMLHLRSGRWVATALNDDVLPMDDNNCEAVLRTYVGGNSHSGSVGAE